MAYEYAISAGPGTLVDYGAVETIADATYVWYDAADYFCDIGDPDAHEKMSIIIGYTGDADDCETGR